jgi:hypothetical protein
MHSNPKQKSGPIDNPGEKPKTLRETQSDRLYRVATRENKHRSGTRSTGFLRFFRNPESIRILPLRDPQAMRGKSEKSPGNPHFSPSSQRIRLYSGAVGIERGPVRDFLETESIFP